MTATVHTFFIPILTALASTCAPAHDRFVAKRCMQMSTVLVDTAEGHLRRHSEIPPIHESRVNCTDHYTSFNNIQPGLTRQYCGIRCRYRTMLSVHLKTEPGWPLGHYLEQSPDQGCFDSTKSIFLCGKFWTLDCGLVMDPVYPSQTEDGNSHS